MGLESGLTGALRTLRVGGVGLLQNFPEGAIGLFHPAVISVELNILRQALGVEIKHIGRDAQNFRELLNHDVLGWIAAIVFQIVQIRRENFSFGLTAEYSV